jgi:hypothetical protein
MLPRARSLQNRWASNTYNLCRGSVFRTRRDAKHICEVRRICATIDRLLFEASFGAGARRDSG